MKKCMECFGKGEILYPICRGTKKDPCNREHPCGYCRDSGHVGCNICGGADKLDDNDDFHR